jgi:hypothetical protein
MAKRSSINVKGDLHLCQQRPTHVAKETYTSGIRKWGPSHMSTSSTKRPNINVNETFYRKKRDLL